MGNARAHADAGWGRFNEWYPSAAKSIKIVCFLTTAYLKSPYCMKEFGIAQAKDKLLVVACEPVRGELGRLVWDRLEQNPHIAETVEA